MSIDEWEFKQTVFLGGRISSQKGTELFKKIAKLGYKDAEAYAFFHWLGYLDENPGLTVEEATLKLVEFMGMAHFLPNTKEITRLSMILGNEQDVRKYGQKPKKGVQAE